MNKVGEIVEKIYRISRPKKVKGGTKSIKSHEPDCSKEYHHKNLVQDGKSHGVT